ncbi:MAG: glutamate-5-semialdehyde dehydrogenase [Eubacterium sp.]|nr:glutamate-5-semialdehyde dehydrogenase [Eubacterium sp.]
MDLTELGIKARKAETLVRKLKMDEKDRLLMKAADDLESNAKAIIEANKIDLDAARENGMPQGLQDRLLLTRDRIHGIATGLRQVAALPDPVGRMDKMWTRPNGLQIGQVRTPIGVIGIIYEARPNVTADAFSLCFKTNNAVILKGGKEAIHSNKAIVDSIRASLSASEITPDALLFIDAIDRQTTSEFMKMNEFVDCLIPRGGAGLIRAVKENSKIPVIETGTGNCHIFVDESADIDMAVKIIDNAKTQRIGVCNACESLVIHEKILPDLMPVLYDRLVEKHVEIRADARALAFCNQGVPASEEDWGKEYLDYIISVKTVDSIEEAIEHINRYNTGHSESIITNDYDHARKFLAEIDAACVYVNASTRFTDGFEFGFGAEIGISTQKLHARGPMGLEALTTTKYIILGDGQIRE